MTRVSTKTYQAVPGRTGSGSRPCGWRHNGFLVVLVLMTAILPAFASSAAGSISGQVVGSDGRSKPGVSVRYWQPGTTAPRRAAITDGNGVYRLELTDGDWMGAACGSPEGFRPLFWQASVRGGQVISFTEVPYRAPVIETVHVVPSSSSGMPAVGDQVTLTGYGFGCSGKVLMEFPGHRQVPVTRFARRGDTELVFAIPATPSTAADFTMPLTSFSVIYVHGPLRSQPAYYGARIQWEGRPTPALPPGSEGIAPAPETTDRLLPVSPAFESRPLEVPYDLQREGSSDTDSTALEPAGAVPVPERIMLPVPGLRETGSSGGPVDVSPKAGGASTEGSPLPGDKDPGLVPGSPGTVVPGEPKDGGDSGMDSPFPDIVNDVSTGSDAGQALDRNDVPPDRDVKGTVLENTPDTPGTKPVPSNDYGSGIFRPVAPSDSGPLPSILNTPEPSNPVLIRK